MDLFLLIIPGIKCFFSCGTAQLLVSGFGVFFLPPSNGPCWLSYLFHVLLVLFEVHFSLKTKGYESYYQEANKMD